MTQDGNTPINTQFNPLKLWQQIWEKLGFFRNVISAIPALLLASAYAFPDSWIFKYVGMKKIQLAQLIHIQAFVIGSFIILSLVGLAKTPTKGLRILRAIAFWVILYLFCLGAHQYGWWGVFTFISLTVATFTSFFLRLYDRTTLIDVIARGAVSYFFYLFWAIVLGMPQSVEEWVHHASILWYGFLYFFILGAIELSGFYQSEFIRQLKFGELESILKKPQDENPEEDRH
jgi:hypothetical protein